MLVQLLIAVSRENSSFANISFLSIPNLNFEFNTAFDSVSDRTINVFGNIMWQSVKLHFSVNTIILNLQLSMQLFSWALEISLVFKSLI